MRTTLVGVLILVAAITALAGGTQSTPDTDNTVTRVELQADGDARWTVVVRTRLENDSDITEYRAFQDRFRENTSRYLDPFRDRITGVVGDAAEASGRPMNATNFTAETAVQQVPRQYGVVRYSFTWTGFARVNGDAVVLGDVFGGGLFVAPGDTFVVTVPDGYAVSAVDPEPNRRDDGTISWVGPQEFGTDAPSVRAAPVTETDETERDGSVTGFGPKVVAGVLVIGLIGAGGVLLYRRQGAVRSSDAAETAEVEPAALRTDADKVEQLLEASGGQVKQSAIADEFDWSASKTSRVVGEMTGDDRVKKRRIGRENVVLLPGETE